MVQTLNQADSAGGRSTLQAGPDRNRCRSHRRHHAGTGAVPTRLNDARLPSPTQPWPKLLSLLNFSPVIPERWAGTRVLKTAVGASLPWVRIPPLPPKYPFDALDRDQSAWFMTDRPIGAVRETGSSRAVRSACSKPRSRDRGCPRRRRRPCRRAGSRAGPARPSRPGRVRGHETATSARRWCRAPRGRRRRAGRFP